MILLRISLGSLSVWEVLLLLLITLLGFLVLRPSISGLLQSETSVITKYCSFFLVQSVTSVITKCDRYYKVRQVLQSVTIITKCARIDFHCVLILFNVGTIWLQIYFTKLCMNNKGNKTKFIDFYLRFRIGTLFHTSNVILHNLYCVTITEHELPVMSWKIN